MYLNGVVKIPLPKSLIKKYGVSKKAWRIYRSKKGSKRSNFFRSKVKKRSVRTMARRRRSFKRYARKSKNLLGKLNKPIVGSIGVVIYESFVSPLIPLTGLIKNVIELLLGLVLSKKGGILGAMGTALVYLNSYQLISNVKGMVMSGTAQGSAW
jgi:hypothetical protein